MRDGAGEPGERLPLACVDELFFEALALGDVLHAAPEVRDAAVGVDEGRTRSRIQRTVPAAATTRYSPRRASPRARSGSLEARAVGVHHGEPPAAFAELVERHAGGAPKEPASTVGTSTGAARSTRYT